MKCHPCIGAFAPRGNVTVDYLSIRDISCAETDVQDTHLQSIPRTEISTESRSLKFRIFADFFPLHILVALTKKKKDKINLIKFFQELDYLFLIKACSPIRLHVVFIY